MRALPDTLARHPLRLAVVGALAPARGLFEGAGLLLLVRQLAIVGMDVPVDGAVGTGAETVVAVFEALAIPVTLAAALGVYIAVVAAQSGLRYLEQERTTALVEDLLASVARADWLSRLRRRGSELLQVIHEGVFRVGDG